MGPSGSAYVCGWTTGSLAANAQGQDAFLAKYDANLSLAWVKQFSSTHPYDANGNETFGKVVVDGAGNLYVAGPISYLAPAYPGAHSYANFYGVVLAKYDANGALLWSGELGTDLPGYYGLALDGNGVIYLGYYQYLARFDTDGNKLWAATLGAITAMAGTSSGCVYLAGTSLGSLDANGTQLWSKNSVPAGSAITVDGGGNIYICGATSSSLDGGSTLGNDAFLAKYDSSGNPVWVRQLHSPGNDTANSVAIDPDGNILMAGSTPGSLGGPNAGGTDAFLAKYDASGNRLWLKQFGTSAGEGDSSIAVNSSGDVYYAGYTAGSLFGTNAGGDDAFIMSLPWDSNVAPMVEAGPDQTIDEAQTTLAGVARGVQNHWMQVSGIGTATFDDTNSPDTTVTFSLPGTYVLRLLSISGDGLANFDDVTITSVPAVPNGTAPTVDAGTTYWVTLPATLTPAGTVSDDGLPIPPGTTTVTWSLFWRDRSECQHHESHDQLSRHGQVHLNPHGL